MSSLEAKRDQFRKYLERSGVIDALSKALIKLYEESNKPDDAVRFIRKHLCESCPDDEQFDTLKADFMEANNTITKLELELNRVKGNIKRTPSETLKLLENGLATLEEQNSKSLVRKYLTATLFEEIKDLKSFYGTTLADCLNTGFLNPQTSKVGAYVGDHDCYVVFSKLFDPIIRECNGLEDDTEIAQPPTDWGDSASLKNLDPQGKFVVSTKIRVSRNLDEYPLFAKMTEDDFKAIMEKISQCLVCLEGEHLGAFYPLELIDAEAKTELLKAHVAFDKKNKQLEDGGGYRFWPTGRGTYYNATRTFIVWINKEDHLQVISMSQTGNLPDVYRRLINVMPAIEKDLKFRHDEHYGYITASPTNVGTALHASVHIKLPKLMTEMSKLKDACESLNLELMHRVDETEDILEISNKRKLGSTEYDIIKEMQDGILELIAMENEK